MLHWSENPPCQYGPLQPETPGLVTSADNPSAVVGKRPQSTSKQSSAVLTPEKVNLVPLAEEYLVVEHPDPHAVRAATAKQQKGAASF